MLDQGHYPRDVWSGRRISRGWPGLRSSFAVVFVVFVVLAYRRQWPWTG
jgi:hypothetical protein